MKHPIPLKRFEYSIPDSDPATNRMKSPKRAPFEMHLPLVKVDIDFEKSNLSLEGNGPYIMDVSQNPYLTIPTSEKQRIKVKATIRPGFKVELTDLSNDGLVFSLDGIIDDGKIIHTCSGLLVLDTMTNGNMSGGWEWYVTVYLFDDSHDERDIKLKLTMYSISENGQLN